MGRQERKMAAAIKSTVEMPLNRCRGTAEVLTAPRIAPGMVAAANIRPDL